MGFFDRLFGNKKKEDELAKAAEEARLKIEQEAKSKQVAESAKKAEEEKLAKEAEEKRLAEEVVVKQAEQEAQAKQAAELAKKVEEERLVKQAEEKRLAEQVEQESQAKQEAEQAKKVEQEILAKQLEEKRIAEEAAAKQAEQEVQAKQAAELAKKVEQERLAKEAEEKRLAEQAVAEQVEQESQAKQEAEQAKKVEQEILAKQLEEKRIAEEAAAKQAEQEVQAKQAAELAKKVEQERLAKEAEEKRLAEEATAKQVEQETQAKEEAESAKKNEEEKLAKEAKEKQKQEETQENSGGLFSRFFSKDKLDKGLEKSKESLFSKLTRAVAGKSKVDDDVLDELEEVLITSDVGVDTTLKIIERIEARIAKDKYVGTAELKQVLREEIAALLEESSGKETAITLPDTSSEPYVIMVVGVNGVGKTTTIGKLAHQFKQSGKSVLLGAADTFRAAAVDQLIIWAERVGVPIVQQGMNADPASVAFDTLQSAKAQGSDVVIIDTAGRLHNKVNLMNELTKIKTVMSKIIPNAPHEILLVLDGSTGQNAFEQAKQFSKATDINALAVTKLDGTAKGGVVIGISDQFQIPVKYIGVGEGMEDLQVFNRKEFVDSFFK